MHIHIQATHIHIHAQLYHIHIYTYICTSYTPLLWVESLLIDPRGEYMAQNRPIRFSPRDLNLEQRHLETDGGCHLTAVLLRRAVSD